MHAEAGEHGEVMVSLMVPPCRESLRRERLWVEAVL